MLTFAMIVKAEIDIRLQAKRAKMLEAWKRLPPESEEYKKGAYRNCEDSDLLGDFWLVDEILLRCGFTREQIREHLFRSAGMA